MAKNKTREPLFHIVKRDHIPMWKSLLIRAGAVLAALIFCAFLCILIGHVNPLKFYFHMVDGALGTPRSIWKLVKDLAVLLCIALAVTPAFKMKFWNIGAEGQVLVGCLASVACVIYLVNPIQWILSLIFSALPSDFVAMLPGWALAALPELILLVCMLLAAMVAGAIWAVIPAIFKAIWNTNETLFTLMMNYIATSLVAFFLLVWVPSGNSSLGELKHGFLPTIGGVANSIMPGLGNLIDKFGYLFLILIVAAITVAMFIYLKYTKHGYEISVVGESQKTANYIGVNVKKVIIRTLILSGALCGVAGFLIVSALDHSITTTTVGGLGFTAIIVSWLAKFNPFVMIGTSFLVTFLEQGATEVVSKCDVPTPLPAVITGIILFFIIGCEFFIDYKIKFRE